MSTYPTKEPALNMFFPRNQSKNFSVTGTKVTALIFSVTCIAWHSCPGLPVLLEPGYGLNGYGPGKFTIPMLTLQIKLIKIPYYPDHPPHLVSVMGGGGGMGPIKIL